MLLLTTLLKLLLKLMNSLLRDDTLASTMIKPCFSTSNKNKFTKFARVNQYLKKYLATSHWYKNWPNYKQLGIIFRFMNVFYAIVYYCLIYLIVSSDLNFLNNV